MKAPRDTAALRYLVSLILSVGIGYVFIRFAFVLFLPFIVGFLVARKISPLVKFLSSRLRFPRGAASFLSALFAYACLVVLLYFLTYQAVVQLRGFLGTLPDALSAVLLRLRTLYHHFNNFLTTLPADLSDTFAQLIAGVNQGISLPSSAYTGLLGGLKKAAFSLPVILISVIATFVSTYFISSDYENIKAFLTSRLPKRGREATARTYEYLTLSLLRWLRAQLFLIFVTFVELLIGFLIMRMEYAGVMAAMIALIDAFPILGVGTILVPWGLVMLLIGDYTRGVSFILLYVIVSVVRNSLEPKIVGERIGLHPLATLISMYVGFRLFGFAGIFLIPLIVITLLKLSNWGYIRLVPWDKEPAA